jgi:phosphatidylinositol glycan class M
MIFVTFNKVITAQYFLWYISLIPLIVGHNKLFDYKKHGGRVIYGLILFVLWLYFELIWNNYSHYLEYKGQNLFLNIWVINAGFLLINSVIIKEIIISDKL